MQVMKGLWPFGVALRGEASNHLMLRWLMTVVVSDEEKASVRGQVGSGKASASEPLLTCRKITGDIETGASNRFRDESGGCPCIGQAVSGMEVARARAAALARNVGRRGVTRPPPGRGGRGEGVSRGRNRRD